MITSTKYTELELVSLLKERSNHAFAYLYDNYSGALYNIILQIVPDQDMANDVLQEAFVNIWRKIDSYDQSKGKLFTWMLNVTRNLSIDTVRSKSFQNNLKNQELPEGASTESNGYVQQDVDNIGLKKVIEKLKKEQRVLIDLAYFKGYTHEEIAEIEGLPLGTVKTRIRSALIQLREHLK